MPWKIRKTAAFAAMFIAVGLAMLQGRSAAAAEDQLNWQPAARPSAIKTVSYDAPAAQPSCKLKWLSHEPASEGRVVPTGVALPLDSTPTAPTRNRIDTDLLKALPAAVTSHVEEEPANIDTDQELQADPPATTLPSGAAAAIQASQQPLADATKNGTTDAQSFGSLPLQVDSTTKSSQKIPTLEQQLRAGRPQLTESCPSPKDLKSICKITDSIQPKSNNVPPECSLGDSRFTPRQWARTKFTWTASGLCHTPLYFEDVQLERYGHTWGPVLQPIVSSVHFFATVPMLPYLMGVDPPRECQYTLGYYRPGNCAPYMLDPFPVSIRGAFTAGAFYTSLPFIF